LASVLEYLVAETLELAGDMTHKSKRKRITPRDISLVIKNDDELVSFNSPSTHFVFFFK
jgi:histone H2A